MDVKLSARFLAQERGALPSAPSAASSEGVQSRLRGCAQRPRQTAGPECRGKMRQSGATVSSVTSPAFIPSPRPVLLPLLCLSNNAPGPPLLCPLAPGPSNLHLSSSPRRLAPPPGDSQGYFVLKYKPDPVCYSAASQPSLALPGPGSRGP